MNASAERIECERKGVRYFGNERESVHYIRERSKH